MHEHLSAGAVLFLTPDTDTAHGLKDALMARQISCESCHEAVEATARIAAQAPELLLLDTRSVAKSDEIGALMNEIIARQKSVSPRLVVLEQRDDIRYRLAAMRAGAVAFLRLTDTPTALAERLARIIGVQDRVQARVLVVDDQPVAALFVARVLQGAGMATEQVTDPMKVMEVLERFVPNLVLMDLHLSGATGIDLTSVIRGQDKFADLPIIFLSAQPDLNPQMAALRIGGDDFLSKPIAPDRLIAAVRGRIEWANARIRQCSGADELDPLTRFASRAHLLKRLDWMIGRSHSARRHGLDHASTGQRAIICLDILGNQETLELVAAEVIVHLQPDDLAARISDRSIAVLVSRQTLKMIVEFAHKLTLRVDKILGEHTMGADVGGGWYPLKGAYSDAATLLSRASKAAHRALRDGGDQISVYERARSADEKAEREADILEAVEAGRLELLYEPMLALTDSVGDRYEMTPRLMIGDGELLPPGEFLSVVAEAGRADHFDRWLLRAGLDVIKRKRDAGEPVLLFIHQSLLGLTDDDWIDWVRDQINVRDLIHVPPILQLEVSEADQQLELAIERAGQLGRLGIRVCLNGIDFSEHSMRVLHAVPSAYVRISSRVIQGPDADSISWLIQSIKACGAQVIATGVNGPATISRLFGAGVDLIQGPYVRPPSIAMDFEFMTEDAAEF